MAPVEITGGKGDGETGQVQMNEKVQVRVNASQEGRGTRQGSEGSRFRGTENATGCAERYR